MKKKLSALMMFMAVVAGLAGGTVAYNAADNAAASAEDVAKSGTRVKWAPCPDGTQLDHGVCVREVVRTVLVAAPVPGAVAVSQVGDDAYGDDDGDDDGDDEGDDEGDEDEDDD